VKPTQVCIGMMDSRRPEGVATVPAHHLTVVERLGRAIRRFLLVSGGGLLLGNVGLFMFPFPHLHLCLFPFALIFGPLIAWFGWASRVVLGASELACPRCHGTVTVPAGTVGWPARFNCDRCAIMIELKPAK
jgi:hypothetical protein